MTFLVSNNVSEMIFGTDWLNQEGCDWSCHKKSLIAQGHLYKLDLHNTGMSKARRIYVQEEVIPTVRLPIAESKAQSREVGNASALVGGLL